MADSTRHTFPVYAPQDQTPVQILPPAYSRDAALVWNNSPDRMLVIHLGVHVSPTHFACKVAPNQAWNTRNNYDGPVWGFWEEGTVDAINDFAMVTDLATYDWVDPVVEMRSGGDASTASST